MFERVASLWRKPTRQPSAARCCGETATDDRRVWVRRHVSLDTSVTPTSGEGQPPLSARILDVSSGGFKMVVRWAFGPGDLVTVELPAQEGRPATTVLACVAHSRLEGDTDWVVGCRFSAELSDTDLAAFGAARTKSVLPDSRNWSRYPCEVTAVYEIVPEGGGLRHEAKVVNISAGGVALAVSEDVPVGSLLSAELHGPNGRTAVTILACVVHVTVQSEHERVLGCNFIRELGDDDLRALA